MSIEIMSLVFQVKGQLTPTQKLLLLELGNHANDHGEGVWPGTQYIMDSTSLGETAVRSNLEYLTRIGILETVQAATPRTSTRRRIQVKMLREMVAFGEKGQVHPAILAAQREDAARKKMGVSPSDTVSPNDTGGIATRGAGVRQPVQGVSRSEPESLIKPQITINKPEENNDEFLQWWEMAKDQLRMDMRLPDYQAWVCPLKPVSFRDGVLRVEAANSDAIAWCNSRLKKKMSGLISPLAGRPVEVYFALQT